MIQHPYEVIVIGSGATGGVAALTLAEAGVRVLVVEAGPDLSAQKALGSEPGNTLRRLDGLCSGKHRSQAQHPGYWKANPLLYANEKENPYTYPSEHPFIWTQGRQVGGRSLTWGGITLRLSDQDLKASRRDGYGPEWPLQYSELAPHYSALEERLKVHGHVDGLEQLPDGNYIAPLPFTASEQQFDSAVDRELGYPVIHSRGFGPHQPSVDGPWPRSSSPGSTLQMALATGKVEILSNHKAERLLMHPDHEAARGVLVIDQHNGNRQELHGELVVLCASTIQSLRLLLSSEVSHHSAGFTDPSGNLGCYLMDHVSTCRFFALPRSQVKQVSETDSTANVLSGAGSFFLPFGACLEPKNQLKFLRGYGLWGGIDRFEPPDWLKRKPDTATGFLIGHGEVLPSPHNKVTLSSTLDRWGVPVPHIDCRWGENEQAMVDHMQDTIKTAIQSAGGTMLPLKELINLMFLEPLLDGALALSETSPPPGYYIHEVGGAAMGESEDCSVVDRWSRLWRCQNVLVVDGACWPTSAWQSPTLTMMAITRRACLQALRPRRG